MNIGFDKEFGEIFVDDAAMTQFTTEKAARRYQEKFNKAMDRAVEKMVAHRFAVANKKKVKGK